MSAPPPSYASATWDAHKQKRFQELHYDTVVAAGTLEQRAELLLQLESEHDAIQALAKDVLNSRNACLPISALPSQVFVRIITFVAQDNRPDWEIVGRKFRVSSKGKLGWIELTYVCKRWRTICLGAAELWREAEAPPYFEAGSTGSDTLRTRMVSVPAIYPALRELHLSHLRISHTETLNLIIRLPILEVLEIDDCVFGDTVARSDSHTVELALLKHLVLVDLYSATVADTELGTHALFFRMLGSLRYPRTATVKLAPKLLANWDAAVSAREISILQTLLLQVLDTVHLPHSLMCAHLALYDHWDETGAGSSSDYICLRAMPSFGDIATPSNNRSFKGPNLDFWRIAIGTGDLRMANVCADQVIADVVGNMAMLSIPDTSIFHLEKSDARPALLSYAFRRIRILRVSIESSEYEMAVWRFFADVLSADAANGGLRLPFLEELWVGPYTVLRKDMPAAIKRLVKRLRDRALHPANKIHTIRLGIVRPAAQSAEGADASMLESLFSQVLWGNQ